MFKFSSLVSILIPAFNEEKYIEKAIESALKQSFSNKEIVSADDASTDKTWRLLQKYWGLPAVRLFRNPQNLGRVGNHQHLLYDLARGDYAVMLDGDDYFLDDDFISEAVALAEKHQLRLVFAEAESATFPFEEGVISYRDIFQNRILFMHGAVLYRRDLALQHDFYSKNIIADDNESFLRFIIGERVGFLKRRVYAYRKNNDPDKYDLEMRINNDLMIESVYRQAVATCPEDMELFTTWRNKMKSTFFYGNLINLGHHLRFGQMLVYLVKYIQKRGYQRS